MHPCMVLASIFSRALRFYELTWNPAELLIEYRACSPTARALHSALLHGARSQAGHSQWVRVRDGAKLLGAWQHWVAPRRENAVHISGQQRVCTGRLPLPLLSPADQLHGDHLRPRPCSSTCVCGCCVRGVDRGAGWWVDIERERRGGAGCY
jgi:hypothetical protein